MKKALGLYIHVPFCLRKCAYCDFYSVTDLGCREAYVRAVAKHLQSYISAASEYVIDSIYFGGGTPSLLTGEEIESLLWEIRSFYHLSEDAEISMEMNPGTVTREKLAAYRAAGVNRLSIGLQSADDTELKTLSRIHTRQEFESAFRAAREVGFDNISVDVMYALPDQTAEVLTETLSYVIAQEPEHISFYGLKIEAETPFGRDVRLQERLPDEDTQAQMYLAAAEQMENAGFLQYEISNFAKKGRECRHNLKYWHLEEYLGFGPGAYSFFRDVMFSYHRDLAEYCHEPNDLILLDESSRLTETEAAVQYVMLGFRLTAGIDIKAYKARFHDDFEARYAERLAPFLSAGYVEKTENGYRLSRDGMLISNYILSEILEF